MTDLYAHADDTAPNDGHPKGDTMQASAHAQYLPGASDAPAAAAQPRGSRLLTRLGLSPALALALAGLLDEVLSETAKLRETQQTADGGGHTLNDA